MKRKRKPEHELADWKNITPSLSDKYTRQIGSCFVARDSHDGLAYLQVTASRDCSGCWYHCNSRRCGGNYRECGFCGSDIRSDGIDVHFVAVRGGA